MIFNRWGQKLDEITDYNNTNNFWSGTNNSKTVPSGTYYYIIDLKNGSELLKGYIAVSYTHLRAHETVLDLVCRLLLEKKKTQNITNLELMHTLRRQNKDKREGG